MIILSLNCRGLGNISKKLALKCLIHLHKPVILMLQEALSNGDFILQELRSLLPGWDFLCIDAIGRSGNYHRLVIKVYSMH